MTNSIERFLKIIPGKKYDVKDIDCQIGPTGDFLEIYGINAIIKSIYTIFSISQGTYIFDPEIGSGLHKFIFEQADITTKTALEQAINSAILIYETRAAITYTLQFFSNQKGFRVNLNVSYSGLTKKVDIDFDESLLKTVRNYDY